MAHTHSASCACSRRDFLGCGAFVAFSLAAGSTLTRRAFAAPLAGETVRTEPFARVEKLADGVWAVVSTPNISGDMRTVSNGGIIAGRDAVLVVEGLNTPAGGAWLSETARVLTGRRPTHVVLTHLHGDHSNGLAGHLGGADAPTIIGTATTRRLLAERNSAPPQGEGAMRRTPNPIVLPDSVIVDEMQPTEIDLGGRAVRLTPRMGHSPSDLTVELLEPRVFWCGDLVFNGMFPYYGDAIPSKLGAACNSMLKDRDTTYIPGHGAVADSAALAPYLALLADVEAAARRANEKGVPADEAWRTYETPAAIGEWAKFRPDVYRFAFEAWERELKG